MVVSVDNEILSFSTQDVLAANIGIIEVLMLEPEGSYFGYLYET
jgi:hypothetical protein